ncbi:MAG: hypothetical protein ACUVXA_18090 [Candidatus Jordarchaeum sp.]|uniref:hypothetical protein n=1 Tax=Candidatus Jordarchaeum sp. TaxID=2823881 RepID=UPI0040492D2E
MLTKTTALKIFRRPGGKPGLSDLISDRECIIFVRRGKGAKELSLAPSLLKLELFHIWDRLPRG